MSDEEFEEAIKKMATEDATKDLEKGKDCFDNFQKSDKFSSMLKSYVSFGYNVFIAPQVCMNNKINM